MNAGKSKVIVLERGKIRCEVDKCTTSKLLKKTMKACMRRIEKERQRESLF